MYKIFIADDEPRIRKGLINLVNSFKLNLEICGEAEDGQTAINKVLVLKPDIVLLDICMPIKTGLEIISEFQGKLDHSKIIIISGHDEFEYAKQALEMKVYGYLLKPVQQSELKETLTLAIDELNEESKKSQLYEWALKQLEKRKDILVEIFLSDLIQGRLTREEINEQEKYFNLKLPTDTGVIVSRIVEEQASNLSEKEFQASNLVINNIIKSHLARNNPYVFNDDLANTVAIFDRVEVDINKLIALICDEVYGKIKIRIKIKGRVSSGDINAIYNELVEEIRNHSHTPIVDAVVEYIEGNFEDEMLGLSSLSNKLNVSSTYISRLLKQETGMTFVEYLTQTRLKKSINYMSDKNMSLLDISKKVGFKSQHYYSTVFKKNKGVSPTEHRQSIIRK